MQETFNRLSAHILFTTIKGGGAKGHLYVV
jgi:hypothetical protein